MKRGLALLVGLAALAGLGWWFGLAEVGNALRRASPAGLAIYAGLTLLVWLGYATRWWLVARTVGGGAAPARLLGARLAGDAVGALLPSAKLAGEPLRIALVRGGGASGSAAAAGVAVDRLLEIIGNMLAVIIYVAIFAADRGSARAPWALAAGMVVLLLLLFPALRDLARGRRPLIWLHGARARRLAPRRESWFDALARVEGHMMRIFQAHPRQVLAGVGLSLLTELLIVFQYRALLSAFGVQVDLPALLLVLIGGGLANIAPTPAGLGAMEALQVVLAGASMGRPDLGFVIGVLVRLHETLLLLAGLLALACFGGAAVAPARRAVERVAG
ncbi:MAG: lysylphosphatidylglycerol synthase transmembrane domain-containing protein [bacterium]